LYRKIGDFSYTMKSCNKQGMKKPYSKLSHKKTNNKAE